MGWGAYERPLSDVNEHGVTPYTVTSGVNLMVGDAFC